jgi:hypothetical protein
MAKGVYTRMKRFTFVKGWLTGGTNPADGSVECGDGTSYPMLVTLDQVAEIFYRCRNTKIEGYEASVNYSSQTYSTKFMDGYLPEQNYILPESNFPPEWQQYVKRGYTFFSAGYGSAEEWLSSHCDPAYQEEGRNYYDGKDELCLWPPDSVGAFNGEIRHASGHRGIQGSPPSTYGAYSFGRPDPDYPFGPAFIDFLVSPEVAFVGASSPLSPDAKLYLRIAFRDIGQIFPFWDHGSRSGGSPIGGYAEVVLSSGTLRFPIYMDSRFGMVSTLVTYPKLVVTEWWPYAKDSPAVPVWNSATGAKL